MITCAVRFSPSDTSIFTCKYPDLVPRDERKQSSPVNQQTFPYLGVNMSRGWSYHLFCGIQQKTGRGRLSSVRSRLGLSIILLPVLWLLLRAFRQIPLRNVSLPLAYLSTVHWAIVVISQLNLLLCGRNTRKVSVPHVRKSFIEFSDL